MSIPANLFVTALRQQRLGFMFSLMMLIMVYLGSLAMAAQATLARTSMAWGHNLENRLTVEVPSKADEVLAARQERAAAIAERLREMPEVANVESLTDEDTARLVKPWISDPALLQALPLPNLIDLNLKEAGSLAPEDIRTRLNASHMEVQVHAHATWMAKLMGFLRGLGYLASVMLFLTGLSIVVFIAFVCRAALAIQHETVELLHYLGATNRTIATQFQRHVLRLALPPAVLGFIAAFATVAALAWLLTVLGGFSLIATATWVTVSVVMSFIPVAAVLLSVLTARVSVLKLLNRLP